MIEFSSVTHFYSKKSEPAVDGLSFTVGSGEVFGFLGPNGAGKSTTIKLLCGILQLTEGEIKVEGHSMKSDSLEAKKIMAYCPDEPNFFKKLTGRRYVNFIADIFSIPEDVRNERLNEYAARFELTNALDKKLSSYSHGMAQKLSLIAALVHDPKVLVLDEPLVGLDPRSARLVKDIIRERADAGGTVFFSTHVLEVAEDICDRIGIIDEGKIIAVGKTSELRGEGSLEEFFLKVTENDLEIN